MMGKEKKNGDGRTTMRTNIRSCSGTRLAHMGHTPTNNKTSGGPDRENEVSEQKKKHGRGDRARRRRRQDQQQPTTTRREEEAGTKARRWLSSSQPMVKLTQG